MLVTWATWRTPCCSDTPHTIVTVHGNRDCFTMERNYSVSCSVTQAVSCYLCKKEPCWSNLLLMQLERALTIRWNTVAEWKKKPFLWCTWGLYFSFLIPHCCIQNNASRLPRHGQTMYSLPGSQLALSCDLLLNISTSSYTFALVL